MGDNYDDAANGGDHLEMAPLTTAKNDRNDVENDGLLKSSGVSDDMTLPSIGSTCSTFCALLKAYASYGAIYAPRFCWTLAIFGLFIPSYYIIADVFFNPIEKFGDIQHDYSNINIQSNFDLQMKNIDHWCLKGGNDSCRCEDPTHPAPRQEYRRWSDAHAGNVKQIADMIEQDLSSPDIAFLGGSVIGFYS